MTIYDTLATTHPDLVSGNVQCRFCEHRERVDSSKCLREGWPQCCGETMILMGRDGRASELETEELDKP